jgi:hypothetical protein
LGKEDFYYITVNGVRKDLSDRLTKLYEKSSYNTKSALVLYVIEKGLDYIDMEKELSNRKELEKLSTSLFSVKEENKKLIGMIAEIMKNLEAERTSRIQMRNIMVEMAKSIGVINDTELMMGKYDVLPDYMLKGTNAIENAYNNA